MRRVVSEPTWNVEPDPFMDDILSQKRNIAWGCIRLYRD